MKKIVFFVTLLLSLAQSSVIYAKNPYHNNIDYKNSVKITILSWFSGSAKLSYERTFSKVHQSGEICAGIIGPGLDRYENNPKGFTLRYGHKFFMGNSREFSLTGFYLRPEIVYSQYSYDSRINKTRSLSKETALLGSIGYQYRYKRFLTDLWIGAGIASGTPADTFYHHGFASWHHFNNINKNIP